MRAPSRVTRDSSTRPLQVPFPFMPGTHALLKMTRPAGKPWAPPTGRTRQASVGRPCVPRRGQATLPRRPGCKSGARRPSAPPRPRRGSGALWGRAQEAARVPRDRAPRPALPGRAFPGRAFPGRACLFARCAFPLLSRTPMLEPTRQHLSLVLFLQVSRGPPPLRGH